MTTGFTFEMLKHRRFCVLLLVFLFVCEFSKCLCVWSMESLDLCWTWTLNTSKMIYWYAVLYCTKIINFQVSNFKDSIHTSFSPMVPLTTWGPVRLDWVGIVPNAGSISTWPQTRNVSGGTCTSCTTVDNCKAVKCYNNSLLTQQ